VAHSGGLPDLVKRLDVAAGLRRAVLTARSIAIGQPEGGRFIFWFGAWRPPVRG
jgi:hypothetical protein